MKIVKSNFCRFYKFMFASLRGRKENLFYHVIFADKEAIGDIEVYKIKTCRIIIMIWKKSYSVANFPREKLGTSGFFQGGQLCALCPYSESPPLSRSVYNQFCLLLLSDPQSDREKPFPGFSQVSLLSTFLAFFRFFACSRLILVDDDVFN